MRFSRISGVASSKATDQSLRQRSSCVILTQNTPPPVARTAAASRLTAGTISRAAGTTACPTASFMKACCRSITTSAVRLGSRSAKQCSAPRRPTTRCTTKSAIVVPFNLIAILLGLQIYLWGLPVSERRGAEARQFVNLPTAPVGADNAAASHWSRTLRHCAGRAGLPRRRDGQAETEGRRRSAARDGPRRLLGLRSHGRRSREGQADNSNCRVRPKRRY